MKGLVLREGEGEGEGKEEREFKMVVAINYTISNSLILCESN